MRMHTPPHPGEIIRDLCVEPCPGDNLLVSIGSQDIVHGLKTRFVGPV